MTKRHFEQFARHIRLYLETVASLQTATAMAEMVASVAKQDNPNFNRERFMRACGLES